MNKFLSRKWIAFLLSNIVVPCAYAKYGEKAAVILAALGVGYMGSQGAVDAMAAKATPPPPAPEV